MGGQVRLDHSISNGPSSAREIKEFLSSPLFKGDTHGVESKDNWQH